MNTNILRALLVICFIVGTIKGNAQVTIGSGKTPEIYSVLELDASFVKGGLRLPRLNTSQITSLETKIKNKPEALGLMIYNEDDCCIQTWTNDSNAAKKWIKRCGEEEIGTCCPNPIVDGGMPQDYVAKLGERVVLEVSATGVGSDKFIYIWYKNTMIMSPQPGGNKLTIASVSASDVADYQCNVKSECAALAPGTEGEVMSRVAKLSLCILPTITTQPQSKSVSQGASYTLTIAANNATEYQWYKGSTAISGQIGATYKITNMQSSNAADYYCKVTNDCGSVNSNNATVSLACPTPTISAISGTKALNVGDNLSLTVTATGTATLAYEWTKGGVIVSNGGSISGATTSNLKINNIQTSHAGSYKCTVTNGCGATATTTTAATVTVTATPLLTNITAKEYVGGSASGTTVSNNGRIQFGSKLELTANYSTSGATPAAYTWYRKETTGGITKDVLISGQTGRTLTVDLVPDNGVKNHIVSSKVVTTYKCVATGGATAGVEISFSDYCDGNRKIVGRGSFSYKTFPYAKMCWMVENSKEGNPVSKKYLGDGATPIPTDGMRGYYYDYDEGQASNVCPAGWSVPTTEQFFETGGLREYVKYLYQENVNFQRKGHGLEFFVETITGVEPHPGWALYNSTPPGTMKWGDWSTTIVMQMQQPTPTGTVYKGVKVEGKNNSNLQFVMPPTPMGGLNKLCKTSIRCVKLY